MTFEFLAPAAHEFREAVDWYLARSPTAGDGFRAAVNNPAQRAMERPTTDGFLVGKRVRKILLTPYDYGLLYFAHDRVIYIVAVARNKRRPFYWAKRLMWI